jgi:predicted ribonuclease YlaK
MSLIPPVLNHLDRPGQDIAIVGINHIRAEHDSVFEFIDQCQHRAGKEFKTEFLRPDDQDDGTGNKIVLMANPSRIAEHNVLDTRIYIVEDTTGIKRSLIKYRIQP